MPKTLISKLNFTAGELSPLLDGRADLSKYHNGAKTMGNFLVLPHGGITRRPGSRHIDSTKTGTKTTRLVPFIFSTIQAYILEFGDQYIRFFKDKGQIQVSTAEEVANGTFDSDIASWTDASASGTITWSGSDQAMNLLNETTGRQTISGLSAATVYNIVVNTGSSGLLNIRVGSTLGGSDLLSTQIGAPGSTQLVTTFNTGAFTEVFLEVNHTGTGAAIADNISIIAQAADFEISSPYLEADLFDLQFTQSADTMYIVHPLYAPRKLTRTDHNAWTLTVVAFKGGDWVERDVDAVTMAPAETTGNGITLTASAASFVAGDVNKAIEIIRGTTTGLAIITAFTSTTVVTIDILTDFGDTTASKFWRLTKLFAAVAGEYPGAVSFHENRLFFGGSLDEPQAIWGSRSGDYENMVQGINDADSVKYVIATDQVNVIKWFSPGEVLLVGTAGGEFAVSASSLGEAITPTNIKIARQSGYGSDSVLPIQVANATIFVQRTGRKLREIAYNFQANKHISTDLMLLSEHLTDANNSIVQIGFQLEPYGIIWCIRTDGTLLALTFNPQQEVIAWHRHVLGGVSDAAGTKAKVESVAIIPSSVGGTDEVWLSVKRYINSTTVRHVELLEEVNIHTLTVEDSAFMDNGLHYVGPAVSTITGLDHLEGEVVDILADGATHAQKTVSSGQITLDVSATHVHVGLHKIALAETMRVESPEGGVEGSNQGEIKRIVKTGFRLYRSTGIDFGPTTDNLETMPDINIGDLMDNPTPLFTGDKIMNIDGGYESESRIVIQQSRPLPATILGLFIHQRSDD